MIVRITRAAGAEKSRSTAAFTPALSRAQLASIKSLRRPICSRVNRLNADRPVGGRRSLAAS
jgi:hypothetical protein